MGSRWYGPGLLLVLVLLLALPGMAHPTPAPEVVAEVVAIAPWSMGWASGDRASPPTSTWS